MYLTKSGPSPPGRLAAILEFTSGGQLEPSTDPVKSFYPFRIPFKVLREAKELVLFSALVPGISFILRKDRYGPYLQGKSAIALTPADAALLVGAIRVRVASTRGT